MALPTKIQDLPGTEPKVVNDAPQDSVSAELGGNPVKQEVSKDLQPQLSLLGLSSDAGSIVNNSNNPSLILNAQRVIINSQADPTMVFGEEGVAISSAKQVSIDADDRVILHGEDGIYLGIPNKGNEISTQPLAGDETPDYTYEPLVLGSKLENLLEDLIQILKNAVILTPTGNGYFREDTQYDLLALQARLSEITSTYAFIDGYSHPKPAQLTSVRPVVAQTTTTEIQTTTTEAAQTTNGSATDGVVDTIAIFVGDAQPLQPYDMLNKSSVLTLQDQEQLFIDSHKNFKIVKSFGEADTAVVNYVRDNITKDPNLKIYLFGRGCLRLLDILDVAELNKSNIALIEPAQDPTTKQIINSAIPKGVLAKNVYVGPTELRGSGTVFGETKINPTGLNPQECHYNAIKVVVI